MLMISVADPNFFHPGSASKNFIIARNWEFVGVFTYVV
jgi:hypothetical protein